MNYRLFIIFCLLFTPPAWGIEIDIDFRPEFSTNPAFDPNANRLIGLFNFAAAYYGDIFGDTHDITINVWYEELAASTNGSCIVTNQDGNPNRATVADIRINSLKTWFIDTTPNDNSEFSMGQTLWSDMTNFERSDYYDFSPNTIPHTFEVGYTGNAVDGGDADGMTDMLSTVLHEVGHALGMQLANDSTIAETEDNDYDFDADFVFGQSLAAYVAEEDNGDPNVAHLFSSYALMHPTRDPGVRRLPSHTDLFSMASAHSYTELYVPRREFYGGSDWNDNSNWSGHREPGSSDEVYVRNSLAVNLSAAGSTGELHVLDDATVNVGSHNFTAAGNISVDNGARIIVGGGTLRATSGGRLRIGREGEGRLIQHSGDVRLANNLTLGENAGSHGVYQLNGGTLIVSNNSPIEVGRSGQGELFQFGGTIDAPLMYVGRFADSDGFFRNLGGLTRIQGAIEIGRAGMGNMRVQTDSDVSSISGTIGVNSDSTGSVTVTGAGVRWTNSGHLTVGYYGEGTIDISDRGLVSSGSGSIGDRGGSDGDATVTGSLSSWEIDGDLSVGINGTGELLIEDGGTVTSFSGFVGYNAIGSGTVTVSGFASKWIGDHLYVGGGVTQPGGVGTVNIKDGGRVIVDSLKTWASGTVNLYSGQLTAPYMDIEEGSFNMTGGRLSPLTVFGSINNSGGRLAPLGDAAGYAIVNGNYAQGSAATLEIGISGSAFGSYDQFDVEGIANLGGTLELSLLADFQPGASDTLSILTAGILTGSFSNAMNGARLATTDGVGSFLVNYGPTSIFNQNDVILSSFIKTLAGDYNGNTTVDAADYVAWRDTGINGQQGYEDWRAHFGQTGAIGSAIIAKAAIPEPPTAMMLLIVGAVACCLRKGAAPKFQNLINAWHAQQITVVTHGSGK